MPRKRDPNRIPRFSQRQMRAALAWAQGVADALLMHRALEQEHIQVTGRIEPGEAYISVKVCGSLTGYFRKMSDFK